MPQLFILVVILSCIQESWTALRQADDAQTNLDGSMLLLVIANAASTFPTEESMALAEDLLRVSSWNLMMMMLTGKVQYIIYRYIGVCMSIVAISWPYNPCRVS